MSWMQMVHCSELYSSCAHVQFIYLILLIQSQLNPCICLLLGTQNSQNPLLKQQILLVPNSQISGYSPYISTVQSQSGFGRRSNEQLLQFYQSSYPLLQLLQLLQCWYQSSQQGQRFSWWFQSISPNPLIYPWLVVENSKIKGQISSQFSSKSFYYSYQSISSYIISSQEPLSQYQCSFSHVIQNAYDLVQLQQVSTFYLIIYSTNHLSLSEISISMDWMQKRKFSTSQYSGSILNFFLLQQLICRSQYIPE